MAWSLETDGDGNVHLSLEGYLDEATGEQLIAALVPLLGRRPRDLVFEVEGLRGYQRKVRTSLQQALVPFRGQIRRIVVVGGSSVVRMGLNMMAMSLGVPVLAHDAGARDPDAPVRRPRSRSGSRGRVITRPMSGPLGPAIGATPTRAKREPSRPIY